MGFFADKFLGEVRREFIARPDASKGQIVYKWPDTTIRKFTQLTVEADELAVFFRDGRVVGTFPPGRYTLDSTQIPFLGILVDAASGGNLFKTEVYFIGTHEFPNLPFGGVVDNVVDAETSLAVGLRVYGDYALKVVDPQALIVNLVGSQNLSTNDQITDWLREMVLKTLRTDVVSHITANQWPILGIAAHTVEIESDTLAAVQEHVKSYGVQIARMGNFTISLSDEDAATLKNYRRDVSYTKLAGGFTQYGAGAALRGIGEGAAKGESGAGNAALLGIGVGLSNLFGAAAQSPAAPPQAPAPPPAAPAPPQAAPAAAQVAAEGIPCTQCGTASRPGAKFCAECGAPLAPAPAHCSSCGTEVAPGSKFCPACGTKL
jgi:membrane protease subunit (stomatin/prohibitin family)